jgi:hypothetical protein
MRLVIDAYSLLREMIEIPLCLGLNQEGLSS